MQAETRHKRFSYCTGKHPDARKRPVSNRNRNGRAPKKAHPVLGALGTGILSVRFEPYPLTVAGVSVDIPSLESKIDIDESLVNLFDTADSYFSLMGKTLKTKRTGDFRVDIPKLYIEFKEALPKGVEINIDVCYDNLLGFELYSCRLVDGVLENTVTKCHFDHLGAQHAHAGHVERLSPCVDLSHVDAALETEHRTHGGRGNAVLSCSGLRDHAGLAHALDEQCLPDRIIDLMGTGMVEVLTLEEHSGVESGAFLDAFGESRRLGER